MHVELVGVHRTLHDGLTEAIGTGDKHHITETGLGVQGEHHTGGTSFRTHHALHAGRQSDQLVVEALVHAVGDGTVVEQGSEDFLGGANHVVHTADVEEGFLLAREGGVRQVFGGGGGTHSHGHVVVAGAHDGEGFADLLVQLGRELGVHHPLANLRAGLGQGIDVIDIEGVKRCVDLRIQAALLEKIAVGLSRSGETAGNRDTGAGQVTDHLAEGCVLAPHMLNIVIAELIEGNYVLYQGDLSTNCIGKAQWAAQCRTTEVARLWPCPCISNNAEPGGPGVKRGLS